MTNYRCMLFATLALSMLGCQTVGVGSGQPARIIDANNASRAELQDAVNTIFGTNVTIADHAFKNSSVLTIERGPRPSMENPNPIGRNMEQPVQLHLVIDEGDCILVDPRNNGRYTLANTACEAE